MTVQVSQATFNALTTQHDAAVAARDAYQTQADQQAEFATDLATVIADLEVPTT